MKRTFDRYNQTKQQPNEYKCQVGTPVLWLVGILMVVPRATAGANPMVRVRLLDVREQLQGVTNMQKIIKSDAAWKKQLTPEQYRVTRQKGTEPAFCGVFFDHKREGLSMLVWRWRSLPWFF